jgi:hypothetical protein
MTPLEKLCQIPDTQGRIDAVAADLEKDQRQFDGIDSWDLADALSLQLDGPANFMRAINELPLDDLDHGFPAWESLELLEGRIPAKRYTELQAQVEKIVDGTLTGDIELNTDERKLMNVALAEQQMNDGAGWQINQHSLTATNGQEVEFEVNQGDGGELFDLTGPYEIHDNGWPSHAGLIIGENWS